MVADQSGLSENAVLGGRLLLRQPLRGHRVGHDAILLAAATAAYDGEHVVDLGAGVGGAGLALARRVAGVAVTLLDIDPALVALAGANAARNGLAERVRSTCLDVAAPAAAFAAAGLAAGSADRVMMNPPFNTLQNPSPDPCRRLAHSASQGTLRLWLRTSARLLRSGGMLTLIWRADRLDDMFAALANGFGAISLLPIYPKPGMPAIRVLIRAAKGSRNPISLLPGLCLADADGRPTAEAEALLRDGATLPLAAS
jgi:tRNA1(Val) A37 N6-methylase TrmN6